MAAGLLPRSLLKRAALAVLLALLLGLSYRAFPLGARGVPPFPDDLALVLPWAAAAGPYHLIGFAAYAVPLYLLLLAAMLLRKERLARRRKVLYRGVLLLVFASFWLTTIAGVLQGAEGWGGLAGSLYFGLFTLVLGRTLGAVAAFLFLALLTLYAAGVEPRWSRIRAGIGDFLAFVRGLFTSRPAPRPATPAPSRPEPGGDDVWMPGPLTPGGTAGGGPTGGETPTPAPTPAPSSGPGTILRPPEGAEPLPVSILPELDAEAEREHLEALVPEMSAGIVEAVREVGGLSLVPRPDETEIGLGRISLVFEKEGGQARSVRHLDKCLPDVGLALGRSPVNLTLDERIRFEVPLESGERRYVPIRPLLEETPARGGPPTYLLGRRQDGTPFELDAGSSVHVLVAGETGGGKSVLLHTMIYGIVFRHAPRDAGLVLVDFKSTEFRRYAGLPHLWTPPVDDEAVFHDLVEALWEELRRRKDAVEASRGAPLPWLFVIVDEFSGIDTQQLTVLIAQARAFNMRFVLATQYPDARTISPRVKANLVTRVAFRVGDVAASQLVVGSSSATRLTGRGDGLVRTGGELVRIQAGWVRAETEDPSDMSNLTEHLGRGGSNA